MVSRTDVARWHQDLAVPVDLEQNKRRSRSQPTQLIHQEGHAYEARDAATRIMVVSRGEWVLEQDSDWMQTFATDIKWLVIPVSRYQKPEFRQSHFLDDEMQFAIGKRGPRDVRTSLIQRQNSNKCSS
jgi:hypothetical protein